MLAEVRKLMGLTQEELAKRVDVTQNYYAVIESNPTKSAPLIRKLSGELNMTEQYLAFADRSLYPFLKDFYTFYLDEKKPHVAYSFLSSNIVMESTFADIVFFLRSPGRFSPVTNAICFALRDDHGTVFLVTCKTKPKAFGEVMRRRLGAEGKPEELKREQNRFIFCVPKVNYLRRDLYKRDNMLVYERTVVAPDSLFMKLTEGTVGYKDVAEFFPDRTYFQRLYEAHKR